MVFPWPGSTVHCIYGFGQKPGQESGQKPGQQSGQKLSENSRKNRLNASYKPPRSSSRKTRNGQELRLLVQHTLRSAEAGELNARAVANVAYAAACSGYNIELLGLLSAALAT